MSIILGILATLLAGLNIFQLLSFRSYRKKYKAEAEKDEAEATESKQSSLERRLVAIEKLYEEQGEVIDKLRGDVLKLSSEKFESEKRIVQLEGENRTLNEKFIHLTKQLEAYKTISGK